MYEKYSNLQRQGESMIRDAVAQFAGAKYLNLETFRKTGVGVRTPVWFARDVLRNAPTITVFYILDISIFVELWKKQMPSRPWQPSRRITVSTCSACWCRPDR